MSRATPLQQLNSMRSRISHQVRNLRRERRWTQAELARHLDLSQSRLSEIEGGRGSLTAEQFLMLLKLFNVPASQFGGPQPDREGQTQNALLRFGARDLRQSPHVLPGEELDASAAIREALLNGHPRLVVSAGVVVIRNVENINLKRLQMDLVDVGAAGRLPWLINIVLHAATSYLSEQAVPDDWASRLRRAEAVLSPFQDALEASRDHSRPLVWDVLDPNIRSKQTVEEVKQGNSAVSNYWGIVTRLQLQDFVDALRSSAGDD